MASKLVINKINEIQHKEFAPSPKRAEREREIKEHPERNHTLSLPFTSFRCEQIGKKLIKIIKNLTPNYNLNIVFQTIKLSSKIYPRLKLKKPFESKVNVVYEFKCDCNNNYIGETKKRLRDRILEHGVECRSTTIYDHVFDESCPSFADNLLIYLKNNKPANSTAKKTRYGPAIIANSAATSRLKREFFINHFKILGSNFRHEQQRVKTESVFIKINQPSLNIQNFIIKKKDYNNKEPATLTLI